MAQKIIPFLFENLLLFSLLFAGVWLIKLAFYKKISAAMHYILWGIVILKLILPVSLPSEASPWNLFIQKKAKAQNVSVQNKDIKPETKDVFVNRMAESLLKTGTNSQTFSSNTMENNLSAQNAPVKKPLSIDYMILAAGIWFAGILLLLLRMILRTADFRRKIIITKNPAPDIFIRVLAQCKEQLHIKKEISLCMQGMLHVPAICGVIKPVLLLPDTLVDCKDEEKIKHVIFHELIHYKHGDLVIIRLLSLLNILYWFFPPVWLAIRLIRKDMETACDNTVIRVLGDERRMHYIRTVIQFAGVQSKPKLIAALNLNDGHKNMKKRINGMYLHKRTRIYIKIPVLLLTAAMVFVCFTTACQPTPIKPVVVNKNDGKLEEKIAQPQAAIKKYEAPEKWKQEYNILDGALIIKVDAKVELPDVEKYPVVRLVEGKFTQEMTDKALKFLYGDTPVYDIVTVETKAELQEQLVREKKIYNELLKKAKPGQKEVELVEGTSSQMVNIDNYKEQIDDLEERIKTAPEKVEKKLLNPTLKVAEDGERYLAGQADMGQSRPAYFNVQTGESERMTPTFNYYNDEESIGPYWGKSDNPPETLEFTKEEAFKKAQDFLNTIGVAEMKPAQIDMVSKWKGNAPTDGKVTGYRIHYTREIKGIQVKYRYFLGEKPPEKYYKGDKPTEAEKEAMRKSYRPTMPMEEMYITVMPNEIREVMWQGISAAGETVNENVELAPFEEVMARFEEMMKVKYTGSISTQEKEKDLVKTCDTQYIDSIELGYARVPVKDQIDQYMYMPVWCFYGGQESYVTTYKNGKTKSYEPEYPEAARRNRDCLLTLNAVDGSIMEHSW